MKRAAGAAPQMRRMERRTWATAPDLTSVTFLRPFSRTQRELVPLLSLQSIAITQSRVMAKDDPRLPLLEKQQQDLYRAAIQRSGRPWKAIAGKAVNRLKRALNDSSSSSGPFMPTSEESTSTHSPLMKAQASPGSQRAGMPSQSANFGSILTIWGSGRQNAPRPARQGDDWAKADGIPVS